MTFYQAALAEKIETIAKAEKVTKVILSELSRELLAYIPDTFDIGMLNRLLGVLTPMNRKTAVLYFKHFLPWQMDDKGVTFTGKDKSKVRYDKKLNAIDEWLANDDNDIWSWAEKNVKVEQKPVDYMKKITADVRKALEDEENPLDGVAIMRAVISGGLTIEQMFEAIVGIDEQFKEAAKNAA
jgi:hypothetical protein